MPFLQRLTTDSLRLLPLGQSREFAERFGQFSSTELPPALMWLLYSLPVVLLGLLLFSRWRAVQAQRRIQRLSATYLMSNPVKIRAALNEACDKHVKVFVRFQRQGPASRYTASALLRKVAKTRLELAISQGLSQDWVGRQVEAFFLLPHQDHGGVPRKYGFTAEVLAVRAAEEIAEVRLPEELTNSDRRQFLRLPIAREMRVVGRLWRVKTQPTGAFDVVPHTWGPPLVETGPDRQDRLENLSGGGLRLVARDRGQSADLGEQFFFRLDLPQGSEKPMVLVFVAAVRYSRRVGNQREMGLSFVHQARRKEGETHLEWVKVNPDFGVELVARWVQQQEQAKVRQQYQMKLDR